MPKNIVIRKHKDKIEIRDENENLIVDIIVANSSKTSSVNLSLKATERTTSIEKVPVKFRRLQDVEGPDWKGFGSFLSDSDKPRPKAKDDRSHDVTRPLE